MEKMAKILIIDDDPDFVEATKAILESKSYEVVAAYDKNEGMEKISYEREFKKNNTFKNYSCIAYSHVCVSQFFFCLRTGKNNRRS